MDSKTLCDKLRYVYMKWVTREKARVDRIACPWVIKRFLDPAAEFVFLPGEKVMDFAREHQAIPFDVRGAELFHFTEAGNEYVSFDSIIKKYSLKDPALLELARIVRGADADIHDAPPESAGLEAAALGFSSMCSDDFENMRLQFPLYDALYRFCQDRIAGMQGRRHSVH